VCAELHPQLIELFSQQYQVQQYQVHTSDAPNGYACMYHAISSPLAPALDMSMHLVVFYVCSHGPWQAARR
jgi:hypothetical protein